jgi:hypothetical protein
VLRRMAAGPSGSRLSCWYEPSSARPHPWRPPRRVLVSSPPSCRTDTGSSVTSYTAKMAMGGWGGGIEMAAAARLKRINIEVYECCAAVRTRGLVLCSRVRCLVRSFSSASALASASARSFWQALKTRCGSLSLVARPLALSRGVSYLRARRRVAVSRQPSRLSRACLTVTHLSRPIVLSGLRAGRDSVASPCSTRRRRAARYGSERSRSAGGAWRG